MPYLASGRRDTERRGHLSPLRRQWRRQTANPLPIPFAVQRAPQDDTVNIYKAIFAVFINRITVYPHCQWNDAFETVRCSWLTRLKLIC